MDNTKEPFNVLSLCTGYGGIELGLKRALGSVTSLAHVEIEAFAIANLVNKMETGQMVPAPIWTDLKTLNARIFRGKVDILTGGYPCQPFSAAGKRKGTEDPRHLWPYIGGKIEGRRNIIEQCRPRGVFFENVEGHISLGVCEVIADLERMGYEVEVGIFSAAEVGAPHQRKRVFILGYLADTQTKNGRLPLRATTEHPRFSNTGRQKLADARRSSSTESQQSSELWTVRACKSPGGTRLRRGSSEIEKESKRGQKLGNTKHNGPPGTTFARSIEAAIRNNQKRQNETGEPTGASRPTILRDLWPSRPGEDQHKWEEPRTTLDDAESREPVQFSKNDR